MKFPIVMMLSVAVALSAVSAAGLREMAADPAGVTGLMMQEVPLVTSPGKRGWKEVPAPLIAHRATVLRPLKDQLGHSVLTVTRSGYLLLACNYDKQGNSSGDWEKSVWTRKDFEKHGWRMLELAAKDGALVQGDGREQVIFYKSVRKGETLDVRCNKYDPPYAMLVHGK